MYTQEKIQHLLENDNAGGTSDDGDSYPLEFSLQDDAVIIHVFCYGMQDASATIVMVITRCDHPLEVRRTAIDTTLFLEGVNYDTALADMNRNCSAWIVQQLNSIEGNIYVTPWG